MTVNAFLRKNNLNCTFILIDTTFNFEKLFQYKEQQEKLQKFGVVYEIQCSCGSKYIGQTRRNLITRLKEHNSNCSPNQETDVTKHLIENSNHNINFNNVKILAQSNNWRKLLIKETLLIQYHSPNLNSDQSSTSLYMFNTWNNQMYYNAVANY